MKKTFPVVVVRPKAALQLGGRRPDDYSQPGGLPRSDLLFAAVCHAWALLGLNEPLHLLEENLDCKGFWLSSAFPFVLTGNEPTYLWPRPMIPAPARASDQEDTTRQALVKKTKKIKWVDNHYLQDALAGNPPNLATEAYKNQLRGEFLAPTKPYQTDEITRASVPIQEDEDTKPFNVGRLWFAENSGYYFLLYVESEKWMMWLQAAFDLLRHEGLGTDRNLGYGFFEYELKELKFDLPEPSGYWLALGLYLPPNADELRPTLTNSHSRWSLVKRGGWITTEGWPEAAADGLLCRGSRANLAPDAGFIPIQHPVWRSGQTLFLPVHLNLDQP